MSETIIILDTETTGLDPLEAEVIEVAIQVGLRDDDSATHLWRCRPTKPIPAEATATHGIKDEDLIGCPTFGEVASDVARVLAQGDVLSGYHVDYDVQMLRAEFRRSGVQAAWPPVVVDCLRLWNIYIPKPKRDLMAAYRTFVDPGGFQGAHGAAADVAATARVLRAQLEQLEPLRTLPWADMDPERLMWWGFSDHAIWRDDDLVCNFGKHRGTLWIDLPIGYLSFIIKSDFPPHVRALAQQVARAAKNPAIKKSGRGALAFKVHSWAREAL